MGYHEIIRRVRRLDFIRNDQTADAAVKSILNVLADSLNYEQRRLFAEKFPELQSLDRFGEDKPKSQSIPVSEYTAGICAQFNITLHQSRTLLRNVLYFTREASGANAIHDVMKSLPNDWSEAIQNA